MARNDDVSKFNVAKSKEERTYKDIVFDSALEMRYYRDVILNEISVGNIVDVELQRPFTLLQGFTHEGVYVRPIIYVADFFITYKDKHVEVIDIKGYADTVSRLKRKLFWSVYPDLPYHWITYSKIDGGWIDFDELEMKRSERRTEKRRERMRETRRRAIEESKSNCGDV